MIIASNHVEAARARETLLRRARFLPEQDAALVRNALDGQIPLSQLARLLGQHPGTLARRTRRLLRLLNDPANIHLMERGEQLPPELRQLGIEHRLHRMTIRQLADRHRLTRYQVCAMLAQLKGCLRSRLHR